ncbi:MAG: polyketide cyclase [Betaproteobacteria bacterium HGW-Betaproteobacteria-7]|nr:MAG: polyketide cyclase [Betaproteobacteria bacterium HGW-Betaproteobacteria-7]
MLSPVVAGIFLAITALLLYAASRPDTFRIERSIRIAAPAAKIFPLLDDFHQWERWSPWEKPDPSLKRTFGGADSGKGATYAWVGNKKIGQGRMTIIESTPPSHLQIQIDFMLPFEAHNRVEFILQRQSDGTLLTHAMFGPSPFISRLLGIFVSMDKMIGGHFEEGLSNLKAIAEAADDVPAHA